MPTVTYENWKPGADALAVIGQARAICADYARQGYDLTLRQLYYQFVARDLIPNTDKSYKRLGSIINQARMAGYLDWDYIVDRTRNVRSIGHFETPTDIIDVATRAYHNDKWANQPTRVEVWVEKEALAGVIERTANAHDVAWFSCRGYVSQSELWGAAQRLGRYIAAGQNVVILHLGDHDPSGIDMTRDIRERLEKFIYTDAGHEMGYDLALDTEEDGGRWEVEDELRSRLDGRDPIEVRRVALNMDQVRQYNPPPNPAKMTDSRVDTYIARFGRQSWELDALDPATLNALVTAEIEDIRDDELWAQAIEAEREGRALLVKTRRHWNRVVAHLAHIPDDVHFCGVCGLTPTEHEDDAHWPPRCCAGCGCGVEAGADDEDEETE